MTNTLTLAITPVDIARDVIKQLNAKKYIASPMTYAGSTSPDLPFCNVLGQEDGRCHVCALGGLFISSLCLTGDNDTKSYGGEYSLLTPYFSREKLALIEATFEGWHGYREEVTQFHDKYFDANDRLRAICENIIANDGEFKL